LLSAAARWKWPAALAACILAAGLFSVHERLDVNWDLKNYHYYDAFAFLEGRLAWDVAPAQIQTYHNPLIDLPFYWLVQAVPSPRVIAAVMAIPTGVAAFFLLRLVAGFFPAGRLDRTLWAGAAFVIGATGAAGLSVIGSTMGEWPPAMCLVGAVALLLPWRERPGVQGYAALVASGLLAGIAAGLKLTYVVFAASWVVAMMSFGSARERFLRGAILGLAVAAGFLFAYGFWGAVLQREFGNPFFPYFNGFFHSPWWEPVNFFDRNFGPRDALQAIFFPFYFARESKLVSEVSFRDWRLAVLMALGFACAVKWLVRRAPVDRSWRALAIFVVLSYLGWLKLFGIYRYLVPLEALSGVLIVGALLYLLPTRSAQVVAALVVAALLVGTTRKGSWGRIDFRGAYFDVNVPALPRDSVVIVGPYEPMAYIIPFLRPDARFVSPHNNFLYYTQGNLLSKRIAQILATHRGPLFTLDHNGNAGVDESLAHYGLRRDLASCLGIRSNLDWNSMRLCRVERLAPQR
jgi:hypothetical protein